MSALNRWSDERGRGDGFDPSLLRAPSLGELSQAEIADIRVTLQHLKSLDDGDGIGGDLSEFFISQIRTERGRVELLPAIRAVIAAGSNPGLTVEIYNYISTERISSETMPGQFLSRMTLSLERIGTNHNQNEILTAWGCAMLEEMPIKVFEILLRETERLVEVAGANREHFQESLRSISISCQVLGRKLSIPTDIDAVGELLNHRYREAGQINSARCIDCIIAAVDKIKTEDNPAKRKEMARMYRAHILALRGANLSEVNFRLAEIFTPLTSVMREQGTTELQSLIKKLVTPIARDPETLQLHTVEQLRNPIEHLASTGARVEQLNSLNNYLELLGKRLNTTEAFYGFVVAFCQSIYAINLIDANFAGQPTWRLFEQLLTVQGKRNSSEIPSKLNSLNPILLRARGPEFLEAWLRTRDLPSKEGKREALVDGVLSRFFQDLADHHVPLSLIRNYLTTLNSGSLKSLDDAIEMLKFLASHAVAYRLQGIRSEEEAESAIDVFAFYAGIPAAHLRQVDRELAEYQRAQINYYYALDFSYRASQQILESLGGRDKKGFNPIEMMIPPAQRVYAGWRRAADIAHGFGSLLVGSRKTPDGDSPSLVRFGEDLGQVKMMNARGSDNFPGKGFGISNLDVGRILYPDGKATKLMGGKFHLYKKAWPGYAQAIDDLGLAEFIFTRGMIVVSCRNLARYSLLGLKPDDIIHHNYSLVVLNPHFENVQVELAYLVKTSAVRKLVAPSSINIDHFRGFDKGKADLNEVIASVNDLKRFLTEEDALIDIGAPSLIAKGVIGDEHAAWISHREEVLDHNDRIKEWDKTFRKSRQENYKEESQLIRKSDQLMERLKQLQKSKFEEERIWTVAHDLFNLYDLFRISLSYWHRGLTIPRGDNQSMQIEISDDTDNQGNLNPHASRMLKEAYRWHSQREAGVHDRSRYYVLVEADALNSSLSPSANWYIDTFDMTAHIDGHTVPLTQGQMTFDDELFWQTRILPLVQDDAGVVKDIRLVPREVLGLS